MAQGNPSPQEPAQVVVLAPIDDSVIVRPSSPASAYILKVTSGLPSGCAEFDGFISSESVTTSAWKLPTWCPVLVWSSPAHLSTVTTRARFR